MIFETHLHLCDEKFDADRAEVIKRAKDEGVNKILNVGAELSEVRKIAALDIPDVYKSLGLHPHNAHECTDETYGEILRFFKNSKNVIAVGEIGLDYYKSTTPIDLQKVVFRKFLNIAKELDLPVVIHSRDAHEDVIKILKEYDLRKKGIIHCYTGDAVTAKLFISMGYVLGIGGVITFPNSRGLKDALVEIPLDSIVLETDAPWLAPQQHRGQRNEPAYLKYVVSVIAAIKGVSPAEVEDATYKTAKKILGFKD